MALRVVDLGGLDCCVMQASATTPGEGDPSDDDYRAFVYLLNPAETCLWKAIDSWLEVGSVLEARHAEGEELHGDMLAGAIERLLEAGQLEAELAKQLDIKVPLYCGIVETPMMLKSLESIDKEEWRLHVEHYWNKGLNEDIWS
jgi:hypothetical protein